MKNDNEIFDLIEAENNRQFLNLELIASENFVSQQVLDAQGSILTNKYAEGYHGKRYYGGCDEIDKIELLAIERAKKLFGAKFANVQPHCGSSANMATYLALAKPGDKILGQGLMSGGHLTHGSKVSFSGILFDSYSYNTDKEGMIDYDDVLRVAKKVKPKIIICGASAYPRKIDFKKFRNIADSVDAYLVADIAHIAGLVVTGFHQSPVGIADVVTTTTHKTLRGPRGAIILTNDNELAAKINKTIFPGIQGGPLEHIIAAKAVCFYEALKLEFPIYIKNVLENMQVLANELKSFGFNLVTNGSDNHLALIDLRNKNITGIEFQIALEKAGITVNKNSVPNDDKPANITSGIRIGTPAITTRGMGADEMEKIANWIWLVSENINKQEFLTKIRNEVETLCREFPI